MLLKKRIWESGGIFDLDNKSKQLEELKRQSSAQGFWDNGQNASRTLKKISIIEKEMQLWKDLSRRHNDMEILFEFAESGEVELTEIKNELDVYQSIIDEVEIKLTLGN